MQLHNPENAGPEECREAIWELIPWYINGSLPADQTDAVKSHSETCELCAAEIARQRGLAREVAKIDPFEVPLSRSFESLRAQIEAEERARSPKVDWRRRFGGLQGGLVAFASVAVVAVMVVFVQPTNNSFETLTSASEGTTSVIKFQTAPGIAPAQLDDVLAQFGATITAGPSETGVYTITVAEGDNMQAIANAMMATSEILFAAPEVAQ